MSTVTFILLTAQTILCLKSICRAHIAASDRKRLRHNARSLTNVTVPEPMIQIFTFSRAGRYFLLFTSTDSTLTTFFFFCR